VNDQAKGVKGACPNLNTISRLSRRERRTPPPPQKKLNRITELWSGYEPQTSRMRVEGVILRCSALNPLESLRLKAKKIFTLWPDADVETKFCHQLVCSPSIIDFSYFGALARDVFRGVASPQYPENILSTIKIVCHDLYS
jgi:hypothetical protein